MKMIGPFNGHFHLRAEEIAGLIVLLFLIFIGALVLTGLILLCVFLAK